MSPRGGITQLSDVKNQNSEKRDQARNYKDDRLIVQDT